MTVLLETRALKKHFGGVQVINGIDFQIDAGEIRCVIGPNGAGKSTFFKLITGEHRPSEGSVHFLGQDMSHVLPHEQGAPARLYSAVKLGYKNGRWLGRTTCRREGTGKSAAAFCRAA